TGSFWSWRDVMYSVAERLDPDNYRDLARAVYAEMVLAGFTAVGEFHYLHHGPSGVPYADPNEMALSLLDAASDAGIRLSLLDTCYLRGGIDRPLEGAQLRFGDGDAERWIARVSQLQLPPTAKLGAAIHSVRAVAKPEMAVVAGWAATRRLPLHAHVSEQIAEHQQSVATFGMTPLAVLADAGALDERFTAIHGTHF